MKYQKLKRNLYTACVVANLFLIPSPVLWAEQSYAAVYAFVIGIIQRNDQ